MIVEFEDKDLEQLILTGHNRKYLRYERDKKFMQRLSVIFDLFKQVSCTESLGNYSFLHYEKLKHLGTSSVRVLNNRKERLIFEEFDGGIKVVMIELNTTHYGSK